jgi:predicted small lipoprotein YifL
MKKILALLALCVLLAACGNRGDLVLPPDPPPQEAEPARD